MGIVAVFIAKLLDPFGAIIALVVCTLFSSRSVMLWGAIVTAVIVEILLSSMQMARTFSLLYFVVGVFAMAAWVALGHLGIRKLLNWR